MEVSQQAGVSAQLLQLPVPLRLAVNGPDGSPRIVSLWFEYRDGELHCVTHCRAWVLKALRRSPGVGFEVATNDVPYRGVRGHGTAVVEALGESQLLERLILRYLGTDQCRLARWLLARKDEERLIRVRIAGMSHWDYSQRMADIASRTL